MFYKALHTCIYFLWSNGPLKLMSGTKGIFPPASPDFITVNNVFIQWLTIRLERTLSIQWKRMIHFMHLIQPLMKLSLGPDCSCFGENVAEPSEYEDCSNSPV